MPSMEPIGYIRSPYKTTQQIPKGLGATHPAEGTLEIQDEFEPGLTDIEGFSHLIVIWEFDRSEGFSLVGKPPTDDRPHGVFATRSPRRPNPIGLTVVELLSRDGTILSIRGIDMLDGTPILDIKPYLSNVPSEGLRRGWLAEAEARAADAISPPALSVAVAKEVFEENDVLLRPSWVQTRLHGDGVLHGQWISREPGCSLNLDADHVPGSVVIQFHARFQCHTG